MSDTERGVPSPKRTMETLESSVAGDPQARAQLVALIYDDLRAMARGYLSNERDGHTLQPTALVNEAYLRLFDCDRMNLEGRSHFMAMAAITMRRVLVDHARARLRQKRGGGARVVTLDEESAPLFDEPTDILALNEAVDELAKINPRPARVVAMRFFGGLTLEETARLLEVSTQTVKMDWRFARAWLHDKLSERPHEP